MPSASACCALSDCLPPGDWGLRKTHGDLQTPISFDMNCRSRSSSLRTSSKARRGAPFFVIIRVTEARRACGNQFRKDIDDQCPLVESREHLRLQHVAMTVGSATSGWADAFQDTPAPSRMHAILPIQHQPHFPTVEIVGGAAAAARTIASWRLVQRQDPVMIGGPEHVA